ncbi:polyprenyl diphosphate synthase [Streptomyces sp. NPDC029526]|uniref:polyprenyl diphosphate synthase n=1 Tax=Streptomyces sp. NPDC029526 TaxID=3155728 RepID=UPI0033C05FD4
MPTTSPSPLAAARPEEYGAPITGDAGLRAAYRLCRQRTQREDPVEYALIQLAPPALRPPCWALWAAANAIDDLADERDATPEQRARRVEQWITGLTRDLHLGRSSDPVRHALVDTAIRWQLDLSELTDAMLLVKNDASGRHFDDWAAWRAWGRDTLLPWFDQVRDLFDRAGAPLALRLDEKDNYEQFLDGVRLTDILTDLAADLADGDLLLPQEVFKAFPGSGDDLAGLRWSTPVAELIAHLTALARRWTTQPSLTRGMHPGPATIVQSMARLLHAQLDAINQAGPALLHTPPRPARATSARILAPARARAALAWRLTHLTLPAPRTPGTTAPCAPPTPLLAGPRARAFAAPPAHPSGARPPHLTSAQMPAHVAVIMDGNGRWATQQGLPRAHGHRSGALALRDTVHGALDIGLCHLTLYTFSTENWKRDPEEVDAILDVIRNELATDPYRDLDVRIRWHGRTGKLPADLVDLLLTRERTTRDRTGLTLTLCINYGGRDEITRAAARLAATVKNDGLNPDWITENDLARHLPHPDMPDVDLLWRTGNEQRTSNFLPWHSSYAELHFTEHLWPDVDRRHLWQAITEYSRRQRHYGATPQQTTGS